MVSPQEVLNCSFSSWYDRFKSATFESVIIPLPENFIQYLNQDGIFLPLNSDGQPQPNWKPEIAEEDALSDSSNDADEDDEAGSWGGIPSFPELQTAISDTISDLGGSVFAKLNWSSPKDAAWMSADGTLRCYTAAEIFLLLKSSDFISHDLGNAFEACAPEKEGHSEQPSTRPAVFELVLRRWTNVEPSMEFRCFVKDNQLVASELSFRIVTQGDRSTSLQPMYALNRIPKEAIDLSDGKTIEQFAESFDKILKQSMEDDEETNA
ncbi:hypothetical protein HDU76_007277 [Blyttiomyces sp. JEL0837]|nr:hypothetical protein HDU76_007277 [Blyttiomyces sp. JEL0837]